MKDNDAASKHELLSRDDIHNYNNKHRIPVIFKDTGLMDALGVLDAKCNRVALVHK
jgi:hypothetical protein